MHENHEPAQHDHHHYHAHQIRGPRHESDNRPRQLMRKHYAFRRADLKRGGFHGSRIPDLAFALSSFDLFLPERDRNRQSNASSINPNAIFASYGMTGS